MLRINQLAKELGVANQEVIEACEKRLGLQGKSHSSNLTDDQADQLRRGLQGKTKGEPESAPLALHKPSAAVKVVKGHAPHTTPVEPQPEPPKPAPAVLVKKAEPKPEPPAPVEPSPEVKVAPPILQEAPSAPVVTETPAATAPAPVSPIPAEPVPETFSRLKVSTAPATPAPREDKPARFIQLPQARPAGGVP